MKKIIRTILVLLAIVPVLAIESCGTGVFTAKRTSTENLIITGHRGGAGLGAENSLECIRKGIETGATSIEIDVHITADNKIVVCHDPTVDRTTNGSGAINEMTCAGSILIIMIGTNLMGITKIKVANYLPAIFISPFLYYLFEYILGFVR